MRPITTKFYLKNLILMADKSNYVLPDKPDFSAFSAATYNEWAQRLNKELKGAHSVESLTALTDEGIRLQPIYTKEQLLPEYISHLHNWLGEFKKDNKVKYLEPLNLTNATWAEQLEQALRNGADGVWLKTNNQYQQLSKFFHAFDATKLPLIYAEADPTAAFYEQLLKAYASSGAIKGAINRPSGDGHLAHPSLLDRIVSTLDIAAKTQAPVLELTTLFWRAGNLTYEQPNLWSRLLFQMGTSPMILQEIAKVRAFYLLAIQHLEDAGLKPQLPFLHIVGTMAAQSPQDPYSQLLRTSLAGISAVIGGASYLTLLPADASNIEHFRWSRNIVNLLRHESHLEAYLDAAGGSYALDNLTSQIAEKAWQNLQELRRQQREQGNDFAHQTFQDKIVESTALYQQKVKEGLIQVIGLNKFPNPKPEVTVGF